jgi:hypothetical protein
VSHIDGVSGCETRLVSLEIVHYTLRHGLICTAKWCQEFELREKKISRAVPWLLGQCTRMDIDHPWDLTS